MEYSSVLHNLVGSSMKTREDPVTMFYNWTRDIYAGTDDKHVKGALR
jgi:hypothetical protein